MPVHVPLPDTVATTTTVTAAWVKKEGSPENLGWPVGKAKARSERSFLNGFLPRELDCH